MLLLCFDRIKLFYSEYISVISHPATFVVPHLRRLPQVISSQARKFVHTMLQMAEHLLNYHDEDVTLDRSAEIRKQSAIAEAEEPEHELKDRSMTV